MFSTPPTFRLTPTTGYFIAKQLNFSESELNTCKKAAQEYVRMPNFKPLTPCDHYFTSITTAQGCIAFDDQLPEVSHNSHHGFMRSDYLAPWYHQQAQEFVASYLAEKNLAGEGIDYWKDHINICNEPYLERRKDKFNQFCNSVVDYVCTGTLPSSKKDQNSLIYTINRLDEDEYKILQDKIQEGVRNQQKNSSVLSKLSGLFTTDSIQERANKITASYVLEQQHESTLQL